MKKLCITILVVLMAWATGQAQSCLPQGITFNSQVEVDNFIFTYPSCHRIDGDVLIGSSSIENLNGLDNIEVIRGNLVIRNNPNLENLTGLNNLHTIGGDLVVHYNFALTDLAALGNLDSIGGGVTIEDCPLIKDFDGLQGISSIAGSLQVINLNDGIKNFTGLDNITFIGGDMNVNSVELENFLGLNNLTFVNGNILVSKTAILPNFIGLTDLVAIGGSLIIYNASALKNFIGLTNLATIAGNLIIEGSAICDNFLGLNNLTTLTGSMFVSNNSSIQNFSGMNSLTVIGGTLSVTDNTKLKNFTGFSHLVAINSSLILKNNPMLLTFSGLDSLTYINGVLNISGNGSLKNLSGLNSLQSVGEAVYIINSDGLENLMGLENLDTIGGNLFIQSNPALVDLGSLQRLRAIGGGLNLSDNDALSNLSGLDSLYKLGGGLWIDSNASLKDLTALARLDSIGESLEISHNDSLTYLTGLEALRAIGGNLSIFYNNEITDISALSNLQSIGVHLWIFNNPALKICNIYPVCNQIVNQPEFLNISDNGIGCSTPLEVELSCGAIPVLATVRLDGNANCQADSTDMLAGGVLVRLLGSAQQSLRATQSDGTARFGYLDAGAFALFLPQFPTQNWQACADTLFFLPDTIQEDTIRATFFLQPLNQCPDLSVDLWLPPFFRGCLATSPLQVVTHNAGTVTAEAVQLAVVLPAALDLVSSVPPPASQNGDTLFFDLGDLPPFAAGTVNMVVKTSCDSFLLGQTLCLEAFSSLANPCGLPAPLFSEIRLFSQCLSDTAVRFTLKNVGDAPTQAVHDYVIIEDEVILMSDNFTLNPLQSMTVDVATNGSTYRMEATKYDDGTLTAIARENCGGLTPGFITAYWLNDGRRHYDFDCRQVVLAYDPNQKTAMPTGVGPEHLLAANTALHYTIDFQNTGTDTAFRVLLRDILPPQLDVATFRPGYASHPYTWEIIGADSLEVLFYPVMLPDSNVNEAASHGWFSFDIDQKPDLPDGTTIENTASIIFDYNPAIITNTVLHTIGKLTVSVDEPQAVGTVWQVLSNPARYAATFRSVEFVAGSKRFELTDALGRVVRTEHFSGQVFEFQRDALPGGLYCFRIHDARGRVSAGKIVISE